jgi:hypothetical protein
MGPKCAYCDQEMVRGGSGSSDSNRDEWRCTNWYCRASAIGDPSPPHPSPQRVGVAQVATPRGGTIFLGNASLPPELFKRQEEPPEGGHGGPERRG